MKLLSKKRNSPSTRWWGFESTALQGFTLLEVMFAIALMAMGLIYLLDAQSRSIRMAEKGRSLIIASELARKKLLDCKADMLKKGFSPTDYNEEGDFAEEGFDDFTWECHGTRFDMPMPSQDLIAQGMKAQAGGQTKPGGEMGAAILAPFFGLVANTLGDSVRELVTIVRWKSGEESEEMQVTTHVTEGTALWRVFSAIPDQVQIPGMGQQGGTQQQQGPPQQQGGRTN